MIKFFMLPYAGNLTNAFGHWTKYSDEKIEFVSIDYNGRGVRKNHPKPNNWEELIDSTFLQLKDNIRDGDYILFGHSMGAKVAYDLYYKILKMNYPIPRAIFFSGSKVFNEKPVDFLNFSQSEFEDYFIEMGGFSEKILKHNRLKTLIFKLLREDLLILDGFRYDKNVEVIRCPIVVMNGRKDPLYDENDKEKWKSLFRKEYEYYHFSDGHFFICSEIEKVVSTIKKILKV